MKELLNRILVALIGIPLGIYIIWYGSWFYFVSIVMISSIALYELHKLVKACEIIDYFWINLLTLISVLFFTGFITLLDFSTIRPYLITKSSTILLTYFIVYFVVLLLFTLFFSTNNRIVTFSVTVGTLFYVLLPFVSLIMLRMYDFGTINYKNSWMLILTYFFSIWICDTFAYFIGKQWGKHKIAPSVSPKKSWEGGVAGLIGSIFSFILFSYIFNIQLSVVHQIALGFIIGLFGQIGDFVESSFKRDAGLKDTSNMLGKHGGILDRFDSIIFTSPIVLLYIINL